MNALLLAGFIVVVVVIANIIAVRRRKARMEVTRSFAALRDFSSEGDANPFLGTEVDRPQPVGRIALAPVAPQVLLNLAQGRGTVRNVLRGPVAGGEVIVFDFMPPAAEITSGHPSFATYAAFEVAGLREFQLTPRPRFTIGIKTVGFPSHPRFSKRFLLMVNDEEAARRFFSAAVLDACEALSENKEWNLEGGSGRLLVTFGLAAHEALPQLVEESARVAAAMR